MSKQHLSAAQIAAQWGCHRTTVARIMKRFGCSGIKLGEAKQATRRFTKQEIDRVEAAARKTLGDKPT